MIANRYQETGIRFNGGMGTVLQCRDTILERLVAIKIVPNVDRRRMEDELSALLRMRSKHVVQVYDIFPFDLHNFAIVQEYIDGRDLFDVPACENTDQYVKLLWQIACGISDIHECGIIHRDIKPNNMKIDGENILKIFDFGLARNEGPLAATVGFVGTPGYAAPELFSAHARFTESVDVYAFGITALYLAFRDLPGELLVYPPREMVRNYFYESPFQLGDEFAVMLADSLRSDPLLRPRMKDISEKLSQFLLKDRHRALVVYEGEATYLNAARRTVRVRFGNKEIQISYNGFNFFVEHVEGEVYINNRKVTKNVKLPGACVVALGSPAERNARRYITFDLSHPEIVL